MPGSCVGGTHGANYSNSEGYGTLPAIEVSMHKVLILGAGKIGALISGLLAESGDYDVTLGDVDAAAAEAVVKAHGSRNLRAVALDASDAEGARTTISRSTSRTPSSPACRITAIRPWPRRHARATPTTSISPKTWRSPRAVRRIARGASKAFVPQCGLAPGFISIAANELAKHFDELRSIKLRVGALPQHPNNVLKYSLTWSTEGLINEYGNPCESVVDGKIVDAAPLEGLEEIEIDGTLVRGVQHLGWPGLAGRDLRQAVRTDQLQDHALSGALRADAPAHERSEAQFRSRHAEARARTRRAADAAGRGHRVRRGRRQAGWRAARRKLRQQDLSAGDRRAPVVGHPGDHGRRHHRGGRPGAREPAQVPGLRRAGTVQTCRRFSTIASASTTRRAAPRICRPRSSSRVRPGISAASASARSRAAAEQRGARNERRQDKLSVDVAGILKRLGIDSINAGAWSGTLGWSKDVAGSADHLDQSGHRRDAGAGARRHRHRLRSRDAQRASRPPPPGAPCPRRAAAKPCAC